MQTSFERIDRNGPEVKIILHARRDSLNKSLEKTALKYFDEWQRTFYHKLGYKSSQIVKWDREDSLTEGMYYFHLVIKLKGLPK